MLKKETVKNKAEVESTIKKVIDETIPKIGNISLAAKMSAAKMVG